MPKRRHHYVPHFYLKNFASADKRINIMNMRDLKVYRDGNLKDQCYKPHFYGPDDFVENWLSGVEGDMAPHLRSIVARGKISQTDPHDRAAILTFVGIQEARTPSTRNRLLNANEGLKELITEEGNSLDERSMDLLSSNQLEATWLSLSNVPTFIETAASLGMHLIINASAARFVTSDNPVFKYNLYCEKITGTGVLGTLKSGILFFVPLSPNHLAMLYDKEVYKVGARGSESTTIVEAGDVTTLNLMQAVNAERNLLFSDWSDADRVQEIGRRSGSLRRVGRVVVQEAVCRSPGFPDRSILNYHERAPNLGLRLSFLHLTKDSRSHDLGTRMNNFRKEWREAKAQAQAKARGTGDRIISRFKITKRKSR